MKKFLYGCLIVLMAVLFSAATSVALVSCDNPVSKMMTPTIDKGQVSLCLDSIVNPTFDEFSDVIECQQMLLHNAMIDSVLLRLPSKTLKDVYTVLSKKKTLIQKSDIVEAFLADQDIYNNLPQPDAPDVVANTNTAPKEEPIAKVELVQESKTTVTEAPPTRAVEESAGSYKDTKIKGKHALIKQ